MDKETHKTEFPKEFLEFMEENGESPPSFLSERILSEIHAKLNPSLFLVLVKVTGIYFITAILILLICPQFGLTLAAEEGIVYFLNFFGPYICTALCGALFLGSGAAMASLLLLPEELRKLRPLRVLYFAVFGMFALAIFWMLGAEIALGLGVAWLLGSISGESVAFELGWRWRFGLNL